CGDGNVCTVDTCTWWGGCQHTPGNAGTVCRASEGECDVAETCTGNSGACPGDSFALSTTTCTGTSNGGVCDATDYCLGTANTCVDKYKASTYVCRDDAGQCDLAETCTGNSGVCPGDSFALSTTTCTGTSNGGVCDATDYCLGTANTCVDKYKASTNGRGAGRGRCDLAETCTGNTGGCPGDSFALSTA